MSHTTSIKSIPIRSERALFAAVEDLRQKGINCELVANAAPRMYYQNQLQKHMNRQNENCDFVLRVQDSAYDIGFIRQDDGSLEPVFDDYDYAPQWLREQDSRFSGFSNKVGLKHFLGAKLPEGVKAQHWSGHREETAQTAHSIGKFLQSYSKAAAIQTAVDQGYMIERVDEDEQGNIHIHVQC